MTRTIKKWLIAVLLFVMAVAIGVSASAFIGAARADATEDAKRAEGFLTAIAPFQELVTDPETLEADRLFGKSENGEGYYDDTHQSKTLADLWAFYSLANDSYNMVISKFTDEQIKGVEGLETAVSYYNKLATVFSDYSQLAARINSNMSAVVRVGADNFLYGGGTYNGTDYVGADNVNDLYNTVTGLQTSAPGKYGFIKTVCEDNFDNLEKAHTIVVDREALITAFVDSVKEIAYNTDSGFVESGAPGRTDYSAAEGQTIVLGSEDSIKTAKTALEALKTEDVEWLNGHTNTFDFAANYKAYNTASDALTLCKKAVTDFEAEILALYNAVAASADAKYTLLTDTVSGLAVLQDKYNGLSTDTYNDEQGCVDADESEVVKDATADPVTKFTYKELLVSMAETLKELNDAITDANDKITAVTAATAAYNGWYKDAVKDGSDYRDLLKTADLAFNELEADIKAHDEKVYAEEGTEYLVSGYADLVAALAEYAEWDKEVQEIVDDTQLLADELIHPSQGEGKGIDAIFDLYESIPLKRLNLRADQRTFVNQVEVTAKESEDTRTVSGWLSSAKVVLDEAQAAAGALISRIGAYEYSFATQKDLVNLLQSFYKLSETNRGYVNNSSKLLAMKDLYEADLANIATWQAAVKAVTDGLVEDKIDVSNMGLVATAATAYEELTEAGVPEYYAGYTATSDNEAVEDLTLTGDKELTEAQINTLLNNLKASFDESKTVYDSYVGAKAQLDKDIAAVVDLFGGLLQIGDKTVDKFDNLTVKDAQIWAPNVEKITEGLELLNAGLKEGDDGYNALVSYKGAVDYIWKEYPDHKTSYDSALLYVERYAVEGAIASIWAGTKNEEGDVIIPAYSGYGDMKFYDYDANKIKEPVQTELDYITLKVEPLVTAARDKVDGYKGSIAIRNLNFLEAAEGVLAGITQDLNDWAKKVDALEHNEGYGLDLDKWYEVFAAYAKLVGGEWQESAEDTAISVYVKNTDSEGYTLKKFILGGSVDQDKVDTTVVSTAYAKLLNIYTKSNDVVTAINDGMGEIYGKGVDNLNNDDYKKVKELKDSYADLSASQKLLITNYENFNGMQLTAIEVANAFNTLVDELYESVVTNKNVTALTNVYVEYVNAIYTAYGEDVKTLIGKDYETKLKAVDKAYTDAVEAEKLPDYAADIEKLTDDLKKLTDDLAQLSKDMTAADEENASAIAQEISDRIAALEELKSELKGDIAELDGNLTALETALKKADADLKAAIEEQLTALETKINKAITDADTKLKTELEGKISELETKLTKLVTDEKTARESGDKELSDKIAEEIAKVNEAIETAKTALEGSVKTVSDGLAAANTAIENADKAIKEVKTALDATNKKVGELEAANSDLTKKVEDLTGKMSGLVAGIVVVGVALGVAVVLFAVVTFARKKH